MTISKVHIGYRLNLTIDATSTPNQDQVADWITRSTTFVQAIFSSNLNADVLDFLVLEICVKTARDQRKHTHGASSDSFSAEKAGAFSFSPAVYLTPELMLMAREKLAADGYPGVDMGTIRDVSER